MKAPTSAPDTQGAVGRRQLQAGGDQLLQATLEAHAATPAQAERIVRRLVPSSSECSDSCELHGTCDRSICTCGDGYSGDACLALVDECFEVDCGSQGSCSRGLCVCGEGYSGVHCETRDNARPVSPVHRHTRPLRASNREWLHDVRSGPFGEQCHGGTVRSYM